MTEKKFQDPNMLEALIQARRGMRCREVPVGAVIVDDRTGEIVARAHNQTEIMQNPTMHAEMLVIRQACTAFHQKYLDHCTLYVTLEPCAMCAMALSHARIKKIVFGAYDEKMGAIDNGVQIFQSKSSLYKPQVIGGIMEQECKDIMQEFFEKIRSNEPSMRKVVSK